MRALSLINSVLALGIASAETLRNEFGNREVCAGVNGPSKKPTGFNPAVNVSFPTKGDTDGDIAVIIFNFEDIGEIGYYGTDAIGNRVLKYMCDQDSVYAGECSTEDLGKFIVSNNAKDRIKSERVHVSGNKEADSLHFEVKETGYYCVAADPIPGHESMRFNVDVKFQDAYGHLPGEDHPLILFHFIQSLIYVVIMIAWAIPLVVHRHSVLKVQKYITAMGVLMIFEQGFVSLYYFLLNKQGLNAGTITFLVFLSLFTSARLAYTMFLLLIVSCGYSVVHPSLGERMKSFRLLAGGLFCSTFAYTINDFYSSNFESSGSWQGLIENILFLPFIVSIGLMYYQILTRGKETIEYLRSRKQTAKVNMYRKLAWILSGAFLAAVAQVIIILIQLVVTPLKTFITHYWHYKWLMYDGWPNIVYCIALMLIMFIWRPSKDNMRYAMSTQLSQNENDADEFEIGSLHGSDDELPEEDQDDEASRHQRNDYGSSQYDRRDSAAGAQQQRNTMFDAEADHGLSDLESGDEFEIRPEDRNPIDDEDPLVSAPSQQLRKSR